MKFIQCLLPFLLFVSIQFSAGITVAQSNLEVQEQEQEQPLGSRLEELMDESESYNQYKVISKKKLEQFVQKLNDSLSVYYNNIQEGQDQINLLNQEKAKINSVLNETQLQLEESEAINEQINFLGIPMQKGIYKIMVWSVIGVLIILLLIIYMRFKASNRVTKTAQQDLEELKEEYENFRKSSNQKLIDVKRELQTAVNELEKMKGRG